MATATQPVSGIDLSIADAMDVHSDNGFDFGDGDIELDLEPAPSAHHHDGDDDVSIQDVATDGGLELHTDFADQDDFMADNDDLIEPDDIEYGDEEVIAVGQSPMSDSGTTPVQTLEPVDEDLIDYSDDEEEQQSQHDQGTEYQEEDETQDEVSVASQIPPEEDLQVLYSADGDHEEQRSEHSILEDATGQDPAVLETHDNKSPRGHEESQSQVDDEEFAHEDSEEGGILLQQPQSLGNEVEDSHSESHIIAHDDVDNTELTATPLPRDDGLSKLRPVTVNYGGNDLWLFKQYDTDDSGDWLLEDMSLAGSSISDLFQACRSALGDDVSNETEIGFRFDHLHNMELYEDNTACVAVSLERLVDLYHTLHAQDGDSEPDCFYVSLQFRPRFATLLADIAKYAEQGSGFSGLSTAVVAGETHFAKLFSGASTEHDFADWESEEQEDLETKEEEPVAVQLPDNVVQQEKTHDDPEHGDGEPEAHLSLKEHEHTEEGQHHDDDSQEYHNSDAEAEDDPQDGNGAEQKPLDDTPASHDSADTETLPKDPLEVPTVQEEVLEEHESHVSDIHNESVSATELRRREEEDFIDYSDEEGHDDVVELDSPSAKEHSPSSSTVQGDEFTAVEDETIPVESVYASGDDHADLNRFDINTDEQDDPTLTHQEQDSDTYNQEHYPEYDQTYDQGSEFQEYEDNSTGEFSAKPDSEGDTNQVFHGHEYEVVDQQVHIDLDNGIENNDENDDDLNTAANGFIGIEDFLEFNDASEWATRDEPVPTLPEDTVLTHDDLIVYGEEGNRVVEQSVATMSPTADPIATSLTESTDFSPQGQKRSIDEVDNEVDDALGSTDPKRPRV